MPEIPSNVLSTIFQIQSELTNLLIARFTFTVTNTHITMYGASRYQYEFHTKIHSEDLSIRHTRSQAYPNLY